MDKTPIVLIVDDEETNLQLIARILHPLKIDIALALSGAEALKLLGTLVPDLIILDIMMPGMSGFELCRKISSINALSDLPIIFISAKNESSDIIKGFKLGARDYITKPFIKEELISRVKTQLKIKVRENQLKELNQDLEERIQDRTRELTEANKKLKDYNTALQVLLEKRENDRRLIEEKVLKNFENLVLPYIEKVQNTELTDHQMDILKICKLNIEKITSQFIKSTQRMGLTHREVLIANLIAQGKSSQEIATILNSSESTINFHRNNIRKKLGIKNKRENLQVYLQSIEIGCGFKTFNRA